MLAVGTPPVSFHPTHEAGSGPSGWFFLGFLVFNVKHILGHSWFIAATTALSLVYTFGP